MRSLLMAAIAVSILVVSPVEAGNIFGTKKAVKAPANHSIFQNMVSRYLKRNDREQAPVVVSAPAPLNSNENWEVVLFTPEAPTAAPEAPTRAPVLTPPLAPQAPSETPEQGVPVTGVDSSEAESMVAAEQRRLAEEERLARIAAEEKAAAEQAAREERQRLAREEAARVAIEKAAAEQAAREECQRLAREEAARVAAEKAAREAEEARVAALYRSTNGVLDLQSRDIDNEKLLALVGSLEEGKAEAIARIDFGSAWGLHCDTLVKLIKAAGNSLDVLILRNCELVTRSDKTMSALLRVLSDTALRVLDIRNVKFPWRLWGIFSTGGNFSQDSVLAQNLRVLGIGSFYTVTKPDFGSEGYTQDIYYQLIRCDILEIAIRHCKNLTHLYAYDDLNRVMSTVFNQTKHGISGKSIHFISGIYNSENSVLNYQLNADIQAICVGYQGVKYSRTSYYKHADGRLSKLEQPEYLNGHKVEYIHTGSYHINNYSWAKQHGRQKAEPDFVQLKNHRLLPSMREDHVNLPA